MVESLLILMTSVQVGIGAVFFRGGMLFRAVSCCGDGGYLAEMMM